MQSFLADIQQTIPRILTFDLLRYLIGAVGVYLTINIALSGILKNRKIRPDSPPLRQMLTEFVVSMRTVLIFATTGLSIWTLAWYNCITIYANPAERGWGYFAFTLIAVIGLHDTWFYWMHRLFHDPRLFRRLHRRHHLSHNPSPFTSYSFDIGEAIATAIYLPIFLLFVPTPGLVLFIFTAHMMFRNAIGHCGYEVFPNTRSGRPLFDWMTSTTHHDLHHSNAGWNFGLYFTFWDRMMGTEHPEYYQRFANAIGKESKLEMDEQAYQKLS